MEKSANAFRTISEAANELDVPQHVLRFWETKFKQIKPMKRGGGRRFYRPQDVNLIKGIKYFLYGQGYTIKGVQKILATKGVVYTANVWRETAAPNTTTAPLTAQSAEDMPNINLPDALISNRNSSAGLKNQNNPPQGYDAEISSHPADDETQQRMAREKNIKLKNVLAELGEIKQIIKTVK